MTTLPEAVAGSKVMANADLLILTPGPLITNISLKAVGIPPVPAQVMMTCTENVLPDTVSKTSADVFSVAELSFVLIWNAPAASDSGTGVEKASSRTVRVQKSNCESETRAEELACGPPITLTVLIVPLVAVMDTEVSIHPVGSTLSKEASAVRPLNVKWTDCPGDAAAERHGRASTTQKRPAVSRCFFNVFMVDFLSGYAVRTQRPRKAGGRSLEAGN
jgi:hypothetical protein